ncbi:hypothetical protein ASE99_15935 [Serratia sp. Leaf51]|nr:hypothetical protein ASE99_15935 [Serratia sp. Leaf51]
MSTDPAIARVLKKRGSPEGEGLFSLWSVWADAHDLDVEVEVDFEVVVKADLHRGERAKTH